MSELLYYPSIPSSASDERERLLVQKSRPLLSLVQTDLSLAEFKIIDVYLSVINSHNPEENTVIIEKGQLEVLLGVTKILQAELEKRLHNLFQVIVIRDDANAESVNGFVEFSLFEKAQAYQDKDTGLWTVKLTATQSAMHYIFNIESLGYLKYRLRFVSDLKSRYSYCLYLYLKDNAYKNTRIDHTTWEVTVAELKDFLNCKAKRYTQFKFFNADILKPSREEINEKTDIYFDYETIRQGKYIRWIRFKVTDNDKNRTEKLKDVELQNAIDMISTSADVIKADSSTVSVDTEMKKINKTLTGSGNLQDIAKVCGEQFSTEMELSIIYNTLSAFVPDSNHAGQMGLLKRCYSKLLQRMNNEKLLPLRNTLSYFLMIIRNEADAINDNTVSEKTVKRNTAERVGLAELKKRNGIAEDAKIYGCVEILSFATATIYETPDDKSVALYDLKKDEQFEIIGYISSSIDPVYHVQLNELDGYIREDFLTHVKIITDDQVDNEAKRMKQQAIKEQKDAEKRAVIEKAIKNEKINLEEFKKSINKSQTKLFVRGKLDSAATLYQDAYLTVPMDLNDYTNVMLLNVNNSAEVVGCFDLSETCKVFHIVDYGTANLYVDSNDVEII